MSLVRLGDVATIDVGLPFKSAEFTKDAEDVRLLRGDNVSQGRLNWEGAARWPRERAVDAKYKMRAGDVVVAMDRPWVGAGLKRSRLRTMDVPSYLVQRVARLRAGKELDQGFLGYVIDGAAFSDYLLSVQTGTAIPHISGSQIGDFELTLPPLGEQQAIAEVLGALDDKIAANTALARKAEELASLTYDAVTESWASMKMSDLLEPVLGGTPPRSRDEYWNGGAELWISARDITSAPMNVVADTAEKITSVAVTDTKAKPLPAGSVILTARGTVGEVGRLARPASFNQSCYGFRPDTVSPALLYFSVLRACERARSIAHGSVFDTVTKTTFDHLTLAWEPDSAVRAEAALAPLLAVVTDVIEQNRTLAATRDALLPQLMSGKLRVRDAEAAASAAGA